ncbi:MAG: hypothetical protein RL417_2429 [Pseudomonadota bacterium]|jgi:hypothetical protein
MRRFVRFTSLLALLAVLTLAGCSKKEDSGAAGGISPTAPDSELLERLPVTTIGFLYGETGSEAYANFKKSEWYKPVGVYLDKLASMESDLPGVGALINSAKKLPSLSAEGVKDGTETVLFLAKGDAQSIAQVGAFIKLPTPVKPEETLAALESGFKEGGFPTSREKIGDIEVLAFTVQMKDGSSHRLLAAALPDRFGLASGAPLLERLIKPLESIPENDRGIRALKNLPTFQRAKTRSDSVGGQIAWGFLDISVLEDIVRKAIPAETPEGANSPLEALPFETVSYARSMTTTLHDYVWLGTKPGEIPEEALTALASAGAHPGVKNAPANAVGVLSIDGAVIRAAKIGALSKASPEEKSQIESATAALEGLKGLSLVVRNAAGASPFPELTFVIDTGDPAALHGTLKIMLGGLAASGGLPVSSWQTKEIAGSKVDFMSSPIGVGLFIGTVKNAVVLSSAEGAFQDLLGGKTSTEVAQFFSSDHLKGDKAPVALLYLSGNRLVGLIESVQASMAMFTGGKPLVEPEEIASLRSLGAVGTAVSFGNDGFTIHTTYVTEPPAK